MHLEAGYQKLLFPRRCQDDISSYCITTWLTSNFAIFQAFRERSKHWQHWNSIFVYVLSKQGRAIQEASFRPRHGDSSARRRDGLYPWASHVLSMLQVQLDADDCSVATTCVPIRLGQVDQQEPNLCKWESILHPVLDQLFLQDARAILDGGLQCLQSVNPAEHSQGWKLCLLPVAQRYHLVCAAPHYQRVLWLHD